MTIRITAEDLQCIEKVIGDKYADAFVLFDGVALCLQVDLKDKRYMQRITPYMDKNEPKKMIIDRFAHEANRYFKNA